MAAASSRRPTVAQESVEPPEEREEDSAEAQLVSSDEWRSASREKWSYEIAPEEPEEPEEPEPTVTEEMIDPVKEKEQKKRELRKLMKRAQMARFKQRLSDLGVWVEEAQRVEAPVEIKVQKELYIPPTISVANFANLLKIPLRTISVWTT